MPRVILASSSPRRIELLRKILAQFDIIPSSTPEILDQNLGSAPELAELNAGRKAAEISSQFPEGLVIGADTMVYLDEFILGKPADLAQASQMLAMLQGRSHRVVTGVCLKQGTLQKVFSEITEVTFRSLSDWQIQKYLRGIDPLDKAGGYAIQERGGQIIERIRGSYSNVVGLPLERLREELEQFSVRCAS